MSDESAKKYLPTVGAADYLQVSYRTLEKWRIEGKGPKYIKMGPGKGAKVMYAQASLDDWMNGNERDPSAPS